MSYFIELTKDIVRISFWFPIRWISRLLPRTPLMFCGMLLGTVLFLFARQRRRVIRTEIGSCFPEFSTQQLNRITRKAFICFVKDQLDVLLYPSLSPHSIREIASLTGVHNLETALQAGKGALLLLCHLGPNQFLMPILGYQNYPIGQVSLPADAVQIVFGEQKISYIHKKVLGLKRQMEESLPSTHIFLEQGIWEALTWLKQGRILAIAFDGRHGNRFETLDFCGRSAQYSPGPFIISKRSQAPLLPAFILRQGDDKLQLIIEPALTNHAQTNSGRALMESYIQRLEHYFRLYPEQYGMFFYLAQIHTGGKENALFLEHE